MILMLIIFMNCYDDGFDDADNIQDAIGTASDCYDCICWVMESVGLPCPTA